MPLGFLTRQLYLLLGVANGTSKTMGLAKYVSRSLTFFSQICLVQCSLDFIQGYESLELPISMGIFFSNKV